MKYPDGTVVKVIPNDKRSSGRHWIGQTGTVVFVAGSASDQGDVWCFVDLDSGVRKDIYTVELEIIKIPDDEGDIEAAIRSILGAPDGA